MLILPTKGNQKPSFGSEIDYGHPLANNLVGCFPLFEGGGSVTRNLVSGTTYAFQGSPSWRNAQGGLDLDVSGGNDRGIVGAAEDSLKITKAVSFLVRVIPIGTPTGADAINLFGVTNSSTFSTPLFGYGLTLAFGASQLVTLVWNVSGSQQASAGSAYSTFSKNKEHQFVATINTESGVGQTFLYSDNAKVEVSGSGGGSNIAYGSGPRVVIGTDQGASGKNIQSAFLAGYIWNRQLNKSEVSWLWAEPYTFIKPKINKLITFGFGAGLAIALDSKIESASEVKANLTAGIALGSKIESASEVSSPILYKDTYFTTTFLESISEIKATLGKPIALDSKVESISELKPSLKNTKTLSTKIESISGGTAGLVKFLGAISMGVTITPIVITSYTIGVPRPIAYLKNDNDYVGSFSQPVDSSPSDYDF